MDKSKGGIIAVVAGVIGGGLGAWLGSSMGFPPALSGLSAAILALIIWGIAKLIWK